MNNARNVLVTVALVLLLAGCAHSSKTAQEQLAQPSAAPSDLEQRFQAQQQWLRSREQVQANMLSALSPAHKQLLARLVGELATTPDADVFAAVRELDSALTPQEKQGVLTADKLLRLPWQRIHPNTPPHAYDGSKARVSPNDPGMVLLLTVFSATAWRASETAHSQPNLQPTGT